MTSLPRIALFVLFDSLEADLVNHLRAAALNNINLTPEESAKAKGIISRRTESGLNPEDPFDLIYGLDLGEKYDVILRHKDGIDDSLISYLKDNQSNFQKAIPVRNAVMHGRPLTIDEYAIGFAFAQKLISSPKYWPNLARSYQEYSQSPENLSAKAITLLDAPIDFGVLHNLPSPDYEDTGFLKRSTLEKTLKRRILGRYPVITVQGDGGNGKTALTLQTIWNLVESDDHDFDLILWYSAKTSSLTETGIKEITSQFTNSQAIIDDVATYQGNDDLKPLERLEHLLTENKVLLVIDNLETVQGGLIEKLASDVPGDSKIVLTSRVPVGGDLPVFVPSFDDIESIRYLRTLADAHGLSSIQKLSDDALLKYATRLSKKPLLLKWFALGVKSGANPDRIVADPEVALKFCMQNVLDRLTDDTKIALLCLVAISEALSVSVIANISKTSVESVERGVAELTRFGLVEIKDMPNSERLFRVRPFVRSYVTRVMKPDIERINSIQNEFRKVQARFEQSRAAGEFNRYDIKNYVTRSKGEAVAEAKIRSLNKSLSAGQQDVVENGIASLKISDPGYFEVYRFEAFAAYTWSDIPRSIDAYEAALQYGDNQPQLHFYYGGMLMRSGYSDHASEQFAKALELDQNAAPVLREAARNEMRRGRFDLAKTYLTRADEHNGRSLKEISLLIDLWVQYYQRNIDHLIRNGAPHEADEECKNFQKFLQKEDNKFFDETIFAHIVKVIPSIRNLKHNDRLFSVGADELDNWISDNLFSDVRFGVNNTRFLGQLKAQGRQANFGFLENRDGVEAFVPAANVDPEVWQWLQMDGPVEFSIRKLGDGREEAFDVAKVER